VGAIRSITNCRCLSRFLEVGSLLVNHSILVSAGSFSSVLIGACVFPHSLDGLAGRYASFVVAWVAPCAYVCAGGGVDEGV